jgi:hypothetical protein
MVLARQLTGNGFETGSISSLKAFLGETKSDRPNTKSYEEGQAENRADHIRECNSKPWGDVKRFVRRQDYDELSRPSWTRPMLMGDVASDRERMIAMSNNNLLTPEECRAIIVEAECVSQWTKNFPYASKDREALMPDRAKVDDLPGTFAWLARVLPRRICPAVESAFPEYRQASAQNLRLYQAIVLRYDATSSDSPGPVSTPVHQDFSFMTVTVPLNDPGEYEGGGTWIHELQRAVRPLTGHALAHSGRVWHAGHAVSKGRRYALALFFHSAGNIDHSLRFEQRAHSLVARGDLADACAQLSFSLRAYGEETAAQNETTRGRGEAAADVEGVDAVEEGASHVSWGLLANLQLQLGMEEESGRSEERAVQHIQRLRLARRGECDHPALVGMLQNLKVLRSCKARTSK